MDSEDILKKLEPGEVIAYVDGSFDADTGEYGAGVVFFFEGELLEFKRKGDDTEAALMRNIAGELLASMLAMQQAKKRGAKKITIYHDYKGISDWCTGAWKTKKEGTKAYRSYYTKMSEHMDIAFVKVAGHSGNRWNDRADELARSAIGK